MFKIQSFLLIGLVWNIAQLFTIVRGASCEKYISESSDYRLSYEGETGSAHWGMKTKGGYYRTIKKVKSLSDCFEACVKRTKCNSFTYTPTKDKCSLSKKYGASSSKQVDKQSVQFCESRNSIAGFILRNSQSSISLTTPTINGSPAVGPAPEPSVGPAPEPAPSPAPENASPPDGSSPSPPDGTSPSPPDGNSPSPPLVTDPSPAPKGDDHDDDHGDDHDDDDDDDHGESGDHDDDHDDDD